MPQQPYEPFSLPPSSKPPVSEPRPSLAARALRSKPGKLTTQIMKGLTLASGVVSIANTVAHIAGHEEAVTLIGQIGELLTVLRGLF